MAKKEQPEEKKDGRLKQIWLVYKMTRKSDKRIGLVLLGVFLLAAAIAFGLFSLVPGGWVFDVITAVLVGVLSVLIVFGRRAQRAQYAQIEGQPGAAAAGLSTLKRGWKVEPAIAFNKNQDLVHRVVGPPGIVLVGEGNPHRLKSLLATERRSHERVASEAPIYDVVSGDSEGAVPVSKLARHITKLGRNIKPAEMTDILQRLKALDANRSNIPIPKGPMPTTSRAPARTCGAAEPLRDRTHELRAARHVHPDPLAPLGELERHREPAGPQALLAEPVAAVEPHLVDQAVPDPPAHLGQMARGQAGLRSRRSACMPPSTRRTSDAGRGSAPRGTRRAAPPARSPGRPGR